MGSLFRLWKYVSDAKALLVGSSSCHESLNVKVKVVLAIHGGDLFMNGTWESYLMMSQSLM